MARGRADRPVARLAEHDAAREIFGRPLRQAGSRDRGRDRHAAGRLDHGCADRGAQARDLPAGDGRPRLRCRRARNLAGRSQADVPASQHRRRGRRGSPAARRPVRSGQHRHGAGEGRAPARRQDRREREGDRRAPTERPRFRRILGARRRPGRHRDGRGDQLRRHVGARPRRHVGRQHSAACLRAFLSDHRADPRSDAAAGAQGPGRVRLLQGGRRQDDARRLRAGRQAVGHERHFGGFLLRPVARGHGSLRADPRNGREPHADAGHGRHPYLLQRPGELYAG